MKNSISYRITSLILAVFIFISSAGISLNIHYCGSDVYDFTIFGKVKSCQKESKIDSELMSFRKKTCCSFDHLKVETSNDYRFSDFDKEAFFSFNVDFIKIQSLSIVENSISTPDNRVYPPPPEIKTNNIYLKVESFLI